jgi:hypothetical protein
VIRREVNFLMMLVPSSEMKIKKKKRKMINKTLEIARR